MRVDTITDVTKIKQLEVYLKANCYRDYVIFKIGTNLGLRVSDFLDMPVKAKRELIKNGRLPYYTVGHYKKLCDRGMVSLTQQKTSKPIYFDIPTEIKDLLMGYTEGRDDNEAMFESRFDNKALTRIGYFLKLKDAAENIGLKENVGCHTMRKIFGYFHYKQFKDIRLLMAIFNHSKEEVTLRYIGVEQEKINESMRGFSIGSFDDDELDAGRAEMQALKQRKLQAKKEQRQKEKIAAGA